MVNATTKSRKLAYLLNDCAVKVLIAHPRLSDVVEETRPQVPSLASVVWTTTSPDDRAGELSLADIRQRGGSPVDPGLIDQDLCMIIYTSGTTGRPKGVMLTHLNVCSTARSISTYLENVPDDVVCCVLPLAFSYGLYQMFVMAYVGHTLVIERSFAFPVDVLGRMAKLKVTGFAGVPGMYASILQVVPTIDVDLSAIRYMTNAAGPLAAAQIKELCALMPDMKFYSMHGQTECARTCFMDPERLVDKPGSVGKAMPNTELYLVDSDGQRVGPGEVGEMVVRGANVMRGYWNMPDATRQKLRAGPIPGECVLYTGDLFRMDEDGDLFFVSRTDDIIKCKGEKVSPKEVEDVLHEIPEIAEAGVIGVDDEQEGQAVKAFVVLRAGQSISEQHVRRYCRSVLEGHMVPKFVTFCDALPKTESGKLKRKALVTPEGEAS